MRGREAPLPYSLHGAIVQPRAEALQDPDLADRSIMPHDDLEKHVARNAATARVVGIVGLHLAEQTGRLDAAAGPIGSAAGAASGSGADSAAIAFAEPGAFARSGAAAPTGAVAVDVGTRLREDADAILRVGGRGDDRRDDGRQLLRRERRLGLWLRRFRRRLDRLRLHALRQRAADFPRPFAKRLRRRRFLQQAA